MAGRVGKLTDRIGGRLRFVRQKTQGIQKFMAARRAVVSGAADWWALRAWSGEIGKYPWICRPGRFAEMVERFDPELALATLRDPRIVGGGWGRFNLNAYRCGTLDGARVFEKIYLRDSPAWVRLDWAYGRILPQLEGRVRTPRLLHRAVGQRLAVAYFEYLPDVTPMPAAKVMGAAVALRRHLATVDVTGAPAEVADLDRTEVYANGLKHLERILSAAGRDPGLPDRLGRSFKGMPRVFSHGDLSPGNLTAAGAVLDWDDAGIYPGSYDFGRLVGYNIPCRDLREFDAAVAQGAAEVSTAAPGSLEFYAALCYAHPHGVRVDDALIVGLVDRACALRGIDAGGVDVLRTRRRAMPAAVLDRAS